MKIRFAPAPSSCAAPISDGCRNETLTTFTWTGASDGTTLNIPANYSTNGFAATVLPNGHGSDGVASGGLSQWNGTAAGGLLLTLSNSPGFPNSGFGSDGLQLHMVAAKPSRCSFIAPFWELRAATADPPPSGINTVTNDSSTTLTLGDNVINVNWI